MVAINGSHFESLHHKRNKQQMADHEVFITSIMHHSYASAVECKEDRAIRRDVSHY